MAWASPCRRGLGWVGVAVDGCPADVERLGNFGDGGAGGQEGGGGFRALRCPHGGAAEARASGSGGVEDGRTWLDGVVRRRCLRARQRGLRGETPHRPGDAEIQRTLIFVRGGSVTSGAEGRRFESCPGHHRSPAAPGGGCLDSARKKQIGGLDTEELRRFDEVLRAPARRPLNLATCRRPRDAQMVRKPPPSRV